MCRRLGCDYDVHVPEAVVGDSPVRRRDLRALRGDRAGPDAGGAATPMRGRDKSYRLQVLETACVCFVFGVIFLLCAWTGR